MLRFTTKNWDSANNLKLRNCDKPGLCLEKKTIKRILIVAWGRLGETILSTLLLRALRKEFLNAYINYIIGGEGGEILKQDLIINKIMLAEASVFKNLLKEEPYDLAIDLYGSHISRLMAYLSGAPNRIFTTKPGYNAPVQATGVELRRYNNFNVREHFLNILRIADIKTDLDSRPTLTITKEEILFAKQYLERLGINEKDFIVGMQPGGNYELWPASKYAGLGRLMVKYLNAKILIFQGPKQKIIANKLHSFIRRQSTLLPYLDIRHYFSILSKCKLFLTTAGGASHAGPALSVPTVMILARKELNYWVPSCKNSFYFPIESGKKFSGYGRKSSRNNYELNISIDRAWDFVLQIYNNL